MDVMRFGALPSGPWEKLFPSALRLIDEILAIEREPRQLLAASPYQLRHRTTFLEQIREPHVVLRDAFDAIATLEYKSSCEPCVDAVGEFLDGLKLTSLS